MIKLIAIVLYLNILTSAPGGCLAPGFRKWSPDKKQLIYALPEDLQEYEPYIKKFNKLDKFSLRLTKRVDIDDHADILISTWVEEGVTNPEITNVIYKDGYIDRCRVNLYTNVLDSVSIENKKNYYVNSLRHGLVHCLWGPPHLTGNGATLMNSRISTDKIYFDKHTKRILKELY